jgi:hypothetical protein
LACEDINKFKLENDKWSISDCRSNVIKEGLKNDPYSISFEDAMGVCNMLDNPEQKVWCFSNIIYFKNDPRPCVYLTITEDTHKTIKEVCSK